MDRQYNGRKKKDRQYNGRKKKDKKTNNGWQNTTQKSKDWATWITLKLEVNSGVLETKAVPTPPVMLLLLKIW
jgi:hypothetical protein